MWESKAMLGLWIATGLIGTGLAQDNQFWIIKETFGNWEYRAARESKPVSLSGKYELLRPTGSVRCRAADDDQKKCMLMALIDRSGATAKMNLPEKPTSDWISLKGKLVVPKGEPLIAPLPVPPEFQEKTRQGGSRDVTACGGSLLLKAPVCGEIVDINDFRIHWSLPESSGKSVSIILQKVDGSPAMIRRTAEAEKGEYSDQSLREFFTQIQEPNTTVAVTVRVAGQGGREGIRLIQVPSATQSRRVENRFQVTNVADAFVGIIDRMIIAIEEGMWSKAGEEAKRLLQLAPEEPEIHKYALAGVCRSGFEEVKSQLRDRMTSEAYEAICGWAPPDTGQSLMNEIVENAADVSTVGSSPTTAKRLGVALLIGNSSYWDVPLSSVENDLHNMSEALEAVGFDVAVRKNLKEPKNFLDALEGVVKEKRAGPDDVLLVYYSGHGLEIDGKTYLLGTGLRTSERFGEEIRVHAQSAEELLALMERKDPGTRVLMVEACRNDLMIEERGGVTTAKRSGFAFNRSGVPNTYIMFANRPGAPTPARSEYGLMGPFTESFIEALRATSGEVRDVFGQAKKNTMLISPQQEPILETSDKTDPFIMRPKSAASLSNRAATLLNSAESFYVSRDWRPYLATMERARALAPDAALRERLERETDFARNVMAAESEMAAGRWSEAAAKWRKAASLFPSRRWALMNAAIALTLCNQLEDAVLVLRNLSVSGRGEVKEKSSQLLTELLAAMPELQQVASAGKEEIAATNSVEFEKVAVKE